MSEVGRCRLITALLGLLFAIYLAVAVAPTYLSGLHALSREEIATGVDLPRPAPLISATGQRGMVGPLAERVPLFVVLYWLGLLPLLYFSSVPTFLTPKYFRPLERWLIRLLAGLVVATTVISFDAVGNLILWLFRRAVIQ